MAFVPAPGYQPAYSPPIPYTTLIAGGLRVGMVVAVQARLPSDYNRWAINLTTGQEDTSDIALHLNARYDGRDRFVSNSRQGDVWGEEEMKREMPFKSGKTFVILIEVTRNNYQVFANGAHFIEFAHRIPMDRVGWLQIKGDITVEELSIIGSGPAVKGGLVLTAAQSNLLPMMGPPVVNPASSRPVKNERSNLIGWYEQLHSSSSTQPLPFSTVIRGGFIPKRTVVVKGILKSKVKSFSINLKVGYNNDIALHLILRLNKKAVVRNSYINGAWGEEETAVTKNPFKEGEYFDISFRSGEKSIKVYVNGSHCFDYAHRLGNLQQVDKIDIEGDANIVYVFI